MDQVIVSQLGARRHYAVPRILNAEGRLAHLYTDMCASKGWPRGLKALPPAIRPRFLRRLLGRIPQGIPNTRLTTFSGFGLHSAIRRAAARTPRDQEQIEAWSCCRLSELVVRSGFRAAKGFYGFSAECLEALIAARRAGLWTAVDQTNAPRNLVHQLFDEEQERFPDWQARIGAEQHGNEIGARERAEWEAADVVVCGSTFVSDGIALKGGPVDRCVVVPYGAGPAFRLEPRKPHRGPLRVLVVGEVGLRKGSPYVLQAARRLAGRAVFRMVGGTNVLPPVVAELSSAVELVGAVPRAEIVDHYRWADVFLLPSICEGSAGVVYEALAGSLPVICTPNTGSVVRDGIDGFIVPIRDVDAIVVRLEFLAQDPDGRVEMSRNASRRSAEYTLEAYGQRLLAALPLDEAPGAHRLAAAPIREFALQ